VINVAVATNHQTGKPELNDIWAVLTNPVFLWGYAHVLLASLVTGAAVMLAVSAWQLRRGGQPCSFSLFQIGGGNNDRHGVSPSVSTTDIVISLVVFVLLYLLCLLHGATFLAGRRGACPGPVSRPRMAGNLCRRVAAGRDHPREAMPAGQACAQIAGPELKELRWRQTRLTH
jgi:hypothetical protein